MKDKLIIDIEINENPGIFGEEFTVTLKYIKGKTPKGRTTEAGYLEVTKDGFIYNVKVQEYLQNKGYGRALYEKAMFHKGFLKTQYHEVSFEAQRVWKSLIKKWEHSEDFLSGTLTIYPYPLEN